MTFFKYALLLVMSCFIYNTGMAQNNEMYKTLWKKVDSLIELQLPNDADKTLDQLLQLSEKEDAFAHYMKAFVYKNKIKYSPENDINGLINTNMQLLAIAKTDVQKAIVHAFLAREINNYFEAHRYDIYGRTNINNANTSSSIDEWTEQQFIDTIYKLYDQALNAKSVLQKVPIDQFEGLLLDNYTAGEPSIDNLLEFILNDYKHFNLENINYYSKNFQQYNTNDTSWLSLDHTKFINKKVVIESDELDILQRTILSFQSLIDYYIKSNNTKKIAALDFQRLQFFLQQFVFPNEQNLMMETWKKFASKYENLSISARAQHLIITQQLTDKTIEPKEGVAQYETLINKFPNTEESEMLYEEINNITARNLNIQLEHAVQPSVPFKILIAYKNVPSVKFKIVNYLSRKNNESNEDYKKRITQQKSVASYQTNLPAYDDLKQHRVEFKIDPLAVGHYMIIVEEDAHTSNYYNWMQASFQVTNIAFVQNDDLLNVLNRTTGEPIPNATVSFKNDNHVKKYITDTHGKVSLPVEINKYLYISDLLIQYNNDKYLNNQSLGVYSQELEKEEIQYFIFTDRAIYRPGQQIYYKVIAVSKNGNATKILPNEKIEIAINNNYYINEKDSKIKLVTNEFGSVHGSIKAPENGFLGTYYLHVNNSNTTLKIEEYKRPSFQATFDTLKANYIVNKPITVSGTVASFAGNSINNATLAYSINRTTRFPFPWRCYGWPLEQNNTTITSGNTSTDENGKFDITFTALPDGTNPEFWPVFNYEISIKVSDINGETHEYTQQIAAGYRDALPTLEIPENTIKTNLEKVTAKVTNINGTTINNPYTITVTKLNAPKQLLKKRLWDTPDHFLYDEATFKSYFPNDVYKNELDKNTWTIKQTTFTRTFQQAQDINFIKEQAFPDNGWYKITIHTKDINGQEVEQQYFTHAIVNNTQTIEMPIAITSNKMTLEPGEKLITSIYTINKDINKQIIFKTPASRWIKDSLNFVVTEEDRGGLYYKSYFVKDNRYYEAFNYVTVPFSNKDLRIQLNTKRDKLLPGSKEIWNYTVAGIKDSKMATELLTSMYDYSLEMITPAHWRYTNLMSDLQGIASTSNNLNRISQAYFDIIHTINEPLYNKAKYNPVNYKTYSFKYLNMYDDLVYEYGTVLHEEVSLNNVQIRGSNPGSKSKFVGAADRIATPKTKKTSNDENTETIERNETEQNKPTETSPSFSPRTNFNETAFFYPTLRTNEKGEISFEFTMPEALTTWKWRAFAHTKDWKIGYLEGEVKTQKDLMVQPNMPRTFRQGDEVVLSAKVANLTKDKLEAKVWIEILNAQTLQPLILPFRLSTNEQMIAIPAGQSKEISWNLHIPESIYEPVIVSIFAASGDHTDGEEHYIPVITNRMLVTETKPLPMLGNGSKNFELNKLNTNNSNTLLHKGITVEYTANPTWYVVQALPYLASYPYDCAEQVFSRVYANAIAQDIIQKAPQIERIFKEWQIVDTAALLSNLAKNENLKTALLEETPWVLEAQNETAQKQRIAALFETKKLGNDLQKSIQQLSKKQLENGAFPWFEGMRADRYITQTIALGILKMKDKNIAIANDNQLTNVAAKSMQFLESKLVEDYKYIIDNKVKLDKNNLTAIQIQYLYAYALGAKPIPNKQSAVYTYYLQQVKTYWKDQNLMLQAYCAEILNYNNEKNTAQLIIESLRQRAIKNDELGMYWQHNKNYYYWNEAPVETQAAIIQAFKKVDPRDIEIAQMQTWLIKNKQTNRWHTTKATVDACYALLTDNNNLLAQQPKVNIQLGDTNISNDNGKQEAGTGYFITNIAGKDVTNNMGNIKVTISESSPQLPTWGAVYWQYFEQYDKIAMSNNALQIKKEIFLSKNSDRGEQLHAITPQTPIQMGDKIVVRMVLTTDRNLEYVHIKDTRAACFEPKDALSKYQYKGGLGYYQSTKDISTNYFIDYLAKGTYVLEYVAYANAKGTYSSGIASIQCMYAPEFTSHSQGAIIEVK